MRNLIKTFLVMLMLSFSHAAAADDFDDAIAAHNKRDFATALRLLTPLAERGDADAQRALGFMYEHGYGVVQHYKTAAKWYILAAEAGVAEAQLYLGIMYQRGKGVAQDNQAAFKWLTLAAEKGEADAKFELGSMYFGGHGVAQDLKTAVKWLTLAAEQRHEQALMLLPYQYIQGRGVTKNNVKAFMWSRIAVAIKGKKDFGNQEYFAKNMTSAEIVQAEAESQKCIKQNLKNCDFPEITSEKGDAETQFKLGEMYAKGEGIPLFKLIEMYTKGVGDGNFERGPLDYKAAFQWYTLAAKQGYASAQYNLGLMYAKGQGVTQDYIKAHMWINIAAAAGDAEALGQRGNYTGSMTPEKIEQAQDAANDCVKQNFKNCD